MPVSMARWIVLEASVRVEVVVGVGVRVFLRGSGRRDRYRDLRHATAIRARGPRDRRHRDNFRLLGGCRVRRRRRRRAPWPTAAPASRPTAPLPRPTRHHPTPMAPPHPHPPRPAPAGEHRPPHRPHRHHYGGFAMAEDADRLLVSGIVEQTARDMSSSQGAADRADRNAAGADRNVTHAGGIRSGESASGPVLRQVPSIRWDNVRCSRWHVPF